MKSEWIAVIYDMPKINANVIVWIRGEPGYSGMASLEKHGLGSIWNMQYPITANGKQTWCITHWQPKLDPPE